MGSMAAGYLKFAATLNKKPIEKEETHRTVELNISNNSADERAEKEIKIVCSQGITASLNSVNVSLEAGESRCIPIEAELDKAGRKGQIKIYYDCEGLEFTDVYEFGYFNPEITLNISEDKKEIICRVVNPTDQKLEGSLYLAAPFEMWGMSDNALGVIAPLAYSVDIKPFEEKEYKFTVDFTSEKCFNAFWAAAKLCCNGRIHFAFDSVHGPRHNVWAHEFINEIRADNGSIKKLLEM